jgi:hypothetical protein
LYVNKFSCFHIGDKALGTRDIRLKYGGGEITFSLPAGQIYFEVAGTKEPRITLMPQGANTLPVLKAKP